MPPCPGAVAIIMMMVTVPACVTVTLTAGCRGVTVPADLPVLACKNLNLIGTVTAVTSIRLAGGVRPSDLAKNTMHILLIVIGATVRTARRSTTLNLSLHRQNAYNANIFHILYKLCTFKAMHIAVYGLYNTKSYSSWIRSWTNSEELYGCTSIGYKFKLEKSGI